MNLSKHSYFMKYMSSWINYFFENGYISFKQTGYTPTTHPSIMFQWKLLRLAYDVSDTVVSKATDMIHLLGDKGWKIVTIADKSLTSTVGDLAYLDYGPSIELGFSSGTAEIEFTMCIFKEYIIFKDKLYTEKTFEQAKTLITPTTSSGNMISKELIEAVSKTYSASVLGKLDTTNLLKYLNISSTSGMIDSDASVSPIDITKLKVKSKTVLSNLKTLFENRVTVLYHTQYFSKVKNTTYYEAIHSAVIDIKSRIDDSIIDRVYIVNNCIFFESSFNTSKYGNLIKDEIVNDEELYVGKTIYDEYSDVFYYTVYDKDLSNLNIQKYGKVQFKLSAMLANLD